MGDVLGEVLAQAVGIAISPLPVIAAILMLLSARGRGAVVWACSPAGCSASPR